MLLAAKHAVEETADEANAIASGKDLTDAQADWGGKINGAQQKLSQAQATLARGFSDAKQTLSNTKALL